MEKELHKPVLLSEVLEQLHPSKGEAYIDLTAGYGGHASKILDETQNYKDSVLVDRDEFAISFLKTKFQGKGITCLNTDFYDAVLREIECGNCFDMVLADFGVSSPQLDMPGRGFSLKSDGPLDMRMDTNQELTAEKVVNTYSLNKLCDIFIRYGEERPGFSKLIAREIIENRPIKSTVQLAELIKSKSRYSKVHPATKIFQAIRIEVNDELSIIEKTLPLLPRILKPNGRLGIITFHSLEDRLVKNYFRMASEYGEESELSVITKQPIVASEMELITNPRARSAKLRVSLRNPN